MQIFRIEGLNCNYSKILFSFLFLYVLIITLLIFILHLLISILPPSPSQFPSPTTSSIVIVFLFLLYRRSHRSPPTATSSPWLLPSLKPWRNPSPSNPFPFLAAISDTRPTNKTPLRLLYVISLSHPPSALFPCMLSAALRPSLHPRSRLLHPLCLRRNSSPRILTPSPSPSSAPSLSSTTTSPLLSTFPLLLLRFAPSLPSTSSVEKNIPYGEYLSPPNPDPTTSSSNPPSASATLTAPSATLLHLHPHQAVPPHLLLPPRLRPFLLLPQTLPPRPRPLPPPSTRSQPAIPSNPNSSCSLGLPSSPTSSSVTLSTNYYLHSTLFPSFPF